MLLLMLLAMTPGKVTLDNGLTLGYVKQGSGPAVVMITGLGGRLQIWEPLAAQMKQDYTVIRLDNRGMGSSGDLAGPYSVDIMGKDAADLMAALGYERYYVVGLSLGSFAAQALALQFPERVERLVLIGSSAGGTAHTVADGEVMAFWQTMGTMSPEDRALKGLSLSLHPSWREKNADTFQLWVIDSASHQAPPMSVQRQFMAAMAYNHAERAKEIKTPTLVLHGDGDRIVPVANAHTLHKLIPNSTLTILKDSGHIPIIDAEKRTAEAIMGFFKAD